MFYVDKPRDDVRGGEIIKEGTKNRNGYFKFKLLIILVGTTLTFHVPIWVSAWSGVPKCCHLNSHLK